MSLTGFLDAATTMLFEEFQRIGVDAFEAFDRVREWAAGSLVAPVVASAGGVQEPVERVPTAADNTRSMSDFMARLSGVGGMPG